MRRIPAGLLLCIVAFGQTDSRVPDRVPEEARYTSGYVDSIPKPPDFNSAMLWGIAIADTRVPGYQNAQIEIAETQLSCRTKEVDGVVTKTSF